MLSNFNSMRSNSAFNFVSYLPTCWRVWPQAFSGQDVTMNDILHEGEIHQVSPITEENRRRTELKDEIDN